MSSSTSEWKKPTDIMRIHRLKRRSSTGKKNQRQNDDKRDDEKGASQIADPENRKRRNPFGTSNSPSKRCAVSVADKENSPGSIDCDDEDIVLSDSEPDNNQGQNRRLFSVLNTAEQRLQVQGTPDSVSSQPSVLSEKNGPISKRSPCLSPTQDLMQMGQRMSSLACDTLSHPEDSLEEGEVLHDSIPVDWSLKIKMRIVTQNVLDTTSRAKSASEAKALADFVQNVPLEGAGADGLMATLKRVCHYWVYPSLPWFPEFPRIVPDSKMRKQVPGDVGQNDLIQKALYHDWMASLTSVFQQLKSGQCPYFYLCCHHFTVLFRASGIGGHSSLTACLTPTTRGIREALKRDGIEFSMPNLRTSSQERGGEGSPASSQADSGLASQTESSLPESQDSVKSVVQSEEPDSKLTEDAEQETLTTTDEGASLWLEDMGLDRKSFPTLEPSKVKIQREGYQQVDRRAESLVFCEGCEVQALFNFLINCRSCTALTGPQAGIPPTILSPAPFVGATVKSNRIRHSVAKLSIEGETQDAHVLEINGPILPHHHLNISSLLREASVESAIISLNTHEPTAPFNMENRISDQGDEDLFSANGAGSGKVWENGLHGSVRGSLNKGSGLERRAFLREVKCCSDGFSWSC